MLGIFKPAFAAGGCPKSADNLQAFARCMAPLPGGMGMRYIGTMADLDEDHRELLNAMHATQVVPPQVHNGMAGVVNPYSMFYPMIGATAYIGSYYSKNPSYWNYWMFQSMMPGY